MNARRWICPICGGGVNAPERMRRDDTRRFCLACSAKSPRLVERTCPVLDKRREAKAAKRSAKRKAAQAKRDALPYAQRDDLIQRDYRWLRDRLKVWGYKGKLAHVRLDVRRRWGRGWYDHSAGTAWGYGRITVLLGTKADRADVCTLLLHELAHQSLHRAGHSDRWRARFVEAAIEAFGIDDGFDLPDESSHALHYAIAQAVGDKLKPA